ncbi:lytic transglycosylase domain-containing protein [Herbiconiux moechotypicola]|uniref:Transglycosylase SLT domain-containing protein n=1 Tax=Herbiconiux moechotypicola TaxID=637393 RepID=A0ABN3D8G7_9MICO|nr:lytic transglycosylase domain-containing protein [Herbiconiux moechotypicola]MCS5728262.1 lytic transglycosylase domain-containing protein [Herbiconiux moechotypicola]
MIARVAVGALVTGLLALGVWLGVSALAAAALDPARSGAVQSLPAGSVQGGLGAAAAAPVVPVPDAEGGALVTAGDGGAAVALVDPVWAESVALATGIPQRALTGYAAAALRLAGEQPSCGVGWNTLAALGWIESGHGTHGGSALDDAGRAQPAILGPALDGGAYDAISDSDGGALDGDAAVDRAVGPLQFIPQTWDRWGADADGDGTADPQQIDDAALAAGRYLCHYGSLSAAESWRAAVFAYNHLDSYVDSVAATANEYASLAAAVPASGG